MVEPQTTPNFREWIKPIVVGVVLFWVLLFLGFVVYALASPTTMVR